MNLKCKYCGSPMIKDDVDKKFKGNEDRYWICDCGASCIELIRYGKPFRRIWDKEEPICSRKKNC